MQGTPPMLLSRQRSVSSSSSLNSSNGSNTWFPTTSPPTSPPASPHIHSNDEEQQQLLQESNITTPQHRNFYPSNHTTPRTCNGKRRLPAATSVSNRGGSHKHPASTSSFDCQSLQHSLKRVRLSSSPGELRLQSDLKQLVVQNGPWQQVQDDVWACPSQQCRLERCTVDPLRLIFSIVVTASTVTNHHSSSSSSMSHTAEDVTFRLQFPRMYPHEPPTVTHMVQPPLLHHLHSSVQRQHQHQQPPRSNFLIPLETAPPIPAFPSSAYGTATAKSNDDANLSDLGESQPNNNILDGWSPILSLSDVLGWLISEVARGGRDFHSNHHFQSSGHDDDDDNDDGDTMMRSMATGADTFEGRSDEATTTAAGAGAANDFLQPNRFDVGYQRPANLEGKGGEEEGQPSSSFGESTSGNSMMDISME